jgi:hypothetical protein
MFAPGMQRFATIPIGMYPSNSNFHQRQQQPMSLEHAQASLIVTIHWQRANHTWGQAQAVVTDQIRDAYVHSFMERLLIEDVCVQKDIAVAKGSAT